MKEKSKIGRVQRRRTAVKKDVSGWKPGSSISSCANNYYNCHTCSFDRAMKETAKQERGGSSPGDGAIGKEGQYHSVPGKDEEAPGRIPPVPPQLTGRAPFRLCPYDYECHACASIRCSRTASSSRSRTISPNSPGGRLPASRGAFFHLGHHLGSSEQGRPHSSGTGRFQHAALWPRGPYRFAASLARP